MYTILNENKTNVEQETGKHTNNICCENVKIQQSEESVNENVQLEIIKPINRETVHRICSGQVVLSLAIAVKELVENAIDAGATTIEIRLKEYGSELVEVIDNGTGVPKENFAALTLKHYTSKIKEFSDLESVGTLGFRGEALSSLCALSDVVIMTRHVTHEHATKIQYDHNGKIVSENPTARTQGTTVLLSNLFSTLPVRRKEFLKNTKREFSKMCQLLYAYCLVSTNIKISCTNQNSKGAKSTIVATQGLSKVRDNIISVFGSKQISSLIDINVTEPDDDILQQFGVKTLPGDKTPFQFECFISSVTHGSGRSSNDRQFYYVNSRPCEPTKIMKLVNETYKQFNSHQYPFIYLNVFTEKRHVDVNVTPDKRQIYLEKEKLLLATIKSSLLDAFKNFPSTFSMQNLNITKPEIQTTLNRSLKGLKRTLRETETTSTVNLFESFKKKLKHETKKNASSQLNNDKIKPEDLKMGVEKSKAQDSNKKLDVLLSVACKLVSEEKQEMMVDLNDIKEENNKPIIEKTDLIPIEKIDVKPIENVKNTKKLILKTSIEDIQQKIKFHTGDDESEIVVKFRSEITPDSNKEAEIELQKQIAKANFKEMDIVGQFNLGFIITRLNNDLFIIDQHASDEKYNFEQLQLNTVLERQVLVTPKPLQLTAENESLLIENEEIFKKNGFTFAIDHEAEATKKIKMTAIPLSKNVIFGKDDVDELLFMLQDSSHKTCRPSRVKSMFASRACRKSVMVGKSLSQADMRRLIDHMGDIDQPWNCPHGRPTMRHLINLNLINKE